MSMHLFCMQVKVYFKTLELTKITESKKWEINGIMTGLGGVLSLFLGISLVAALEYAELFIRLIVALLTSQSTPRTKKKLKNKN